MAAVGMGDGAVAPRRGARLGAVARVSGWLAALVG
jgi:hypothetical protein